MTGYEALELLKAAKIEVKELGSGYVQARLSSLIAIKFNALQDIPPAIEQIIRSCN